MGLSRSAKEKYNNIFQPGTRFLTSAGYQGHMTLEAGAIRRRRRAPERALFPEGSVPEAAPRPPH